MISVNERIPLLSRYKFQERRLHYEKLEKYVATLREVLRKLNTIRLSATVSEILSCHGVARQVEQKMLNTVTATLMSLCFAEYVKECTKVRAECEARLVFLFSITLSYGAAFDETVVELLTCVKP